MRAAERHLAEKPPRKQQQRSFRTQQKLLDAAVEAFSENGFKGTSTRDIAQRAGVHHPLITYHFNSKEDLWRAAADRVFEHLHTALSRAREETADCSPRMRMAGMIRAYVRCAASQPALHKIVVLEGSQPSPRLDWLVQKHVQPFVLAGVTAMQSLQEAGVAPRGDAALLFNLIRVAAGGLLALGPELSRSSNIDLAGTDRVEALADLIIGVFLSGETAGRQALSA